MNRYRVAILEIEADRCRELALCGVKLRDLEVTHSGRRASTGGRMETLNFETQSTGGWSHALHHTMRRTRAAAALPSVIGGPV
jgi:hypothetical protein